MSCSPSGRRKISRTGLGILQKNKLGLFSQRKNSWAGHMVNIKYKPGLDGPQPSSNPAPSTIPNKKNIARVATSQVSVDLVLFSCLLTMYAHNVVGPRCQENTRRKHFIFPYTDVVGPYYHPLHVLLPIPIVC